LKEAYFTPSTIKQKSVDLLQQARENLRSYRPYFVPERSALLVLDMQRYFLEAESHAFVPSAPAIVPGIQRMVRGYSGRGLPVVLTWHVNTLEDTGLMARWWREIITLDNPLHRIIDDLAPPTLVNQQSGFNNQQSAISNQQSPIVIQKSQYDAFYQTCLEEVLRERNVRQVVICGVMTHLCCETTARSAFVRGFEVFFTVDGTATYNERFHLGTLLNLTHGFAAPVLVAEVLAALEGGHEN
jgi:isochorismate hydrolase